MGGERTTLKRGEKGETPFGLDHPPNHTLTLSIPHPFGQAFLGPTTTPPMLLLILPLTASLLLRLLTLLFLLSPTSPGEAPSHRPRGGGFTSLLLPSLPFLFRFMPSSSMRSKVREG